MYSYLGAICSVLTRGVAFGNLQVRTSLRHDASFRSEVNHHRTFRQLTVMNSAEKKWDEVRFPTTYVHGRSKRSSGQPGADWARILLFYPRPGVVTDNVNPSS